MWVLMVAAESQDKGEWHTGLTCSSPSLLPTSHPQGDRSRAGFFTEMTDNKCQACFLLQVSWGCLVQGWHREPRSPLFDLEVAPVPLPPLPPDPSPSACPHPPQGQSRHPTKLISSGLEGADCRPANSCCSNCLMGPHSQSHGGLLSPGLTAALLGGLPGFGAQPGGAPRQLP